MKAAVKSAQVSSFGVVLCLLTVFASISFAGSATWKTSPSSGDWNTVTNWNPQTVPNGPSDVATFATSNTTAVSLSAQTEVNGISFNSGASAFSITVPPNNTGFGLNISGVGVTNNSGTIQKFVATYDSAHSYGGYIQFFNSATAGSLTSYAVNNAAAVYFHNSSTAGSGTFTLDRAFIAFYDGATAQNGNFTLNPASIEFHDTSTAGSGTFTLNTESVNGDISRGIFYGGTAGNATFTINGATAADTSASYVGFYFDSSAGAATLIANAGSNGGDGGSVFFFRQATGGTSRVELFGNGTGDLTDGHLSIGSHHAPGVTIGSLEGTGSVFLGANRLTVGSNNLSTTFSGVIVGSTGSFASLSKIGKGKFTVTGANTYTGGTTIQRGKLLVNNTSGSGTGTGPVFVNSGQLGGNGTIAGSVTVGDGNTPGALLTPGASATVTGRLIIQSALTFNSDATYKIQVNSTAATTDKVLANGVTINTGAHFTLEDLGSGTLPPGTVFTVINNTSASPIAGTFVNLPDQTTFTTNGNTFKASYEGGTGNDLTLTVQ